MICAIWQPNDCIHSSLSKLLVLVLWFILAHIPNSNILQPSRVLEAESRMTDGRQEQIMAIDWCLEMDLSQEERGSRQADTIDSCSAGKVSESLPHFLKAIGLSSQTLHGLKHVNFMQRLTEREWKGSVWLTDLRPRKGSVVKELNQLPTLNNWMIRDVTHSWQEQSLTCTATGLLASQCEAGWIRNKSTASEGLFTQRQTFSVTTEWTAANIIKFVQTDRNICMLSMWRAVLISFSLHWEENWPNDRIHLPRAAAVTLNHDLMPLTNSGRIHKKMCQ